MTRGFGCGGVTATEQWPRMRVRAQERARGALQRNEEKIGQDRMVAFPGRKPTSQPRPMGGQEVVRGCTLEGPQSKGCRITHLVEVWEEVVLGLAHHVGDALKPGAVVQPGVAHHHRGVDVHGVRGVLHRDALVQTKHDLFAGGGRRRAARHGEPGLGGSGAQARGKMIPARCHRAHPWP